MKNNLNKYFWLCGIICFVSSLPFVMLNKFNIVIGLEISGLICYLIAYKIEGINKK